MQFSSNILYFFFFLFFTIYLPSFAAQKKVMFIVQSQMQGGKGLVEFYGELKKNDHDVKIVLLPSFDDKKNGSISIGSDFIKKFLPSDIVYPCGKNKPYTSCKSINTFKPDFIFTQNPYDSVGGSILDPHFTLKGLKGSGAKIAYIVYGPHLFHQGFCTDTKLKALVDLVFVDSESTKKKFIEDLSFSPKNIVVCGYQNYKNVRTLLKNKKVKDPAYKETILWLPRWTLDFVGRDKGEGGSTFLSYYHFFCNYAQEHPDTKLIIRPHTLLFKHGIEGKFLSQKDANAILKKFKSIKNIVFSNHGTDPLEKDVIQADIVISDGTSALGEVVVANKPIIYLSNGLNLEFESNALGKEFKDYIYLAYNPHDILRYLKIIRKKNYVPFATHSRIMKHLDKYLGVPDHKAEYLFQQFKKKLDPVENPAACIAAYVGAH